MEEIGGRWGKEGEWGSPCHWLRLGSCTGAEYCDEVMKLVRAQSVCSSVHGRFVVVDCAFEAVWSTVHGAVLSYVLVNKAWNNGFVGSNLLNKPAKFGAKTVTCFWEYTVLGLGFFYGPTPCRIDRTTEENSRTDRNSITICCCL